MILKIASLSFLPDLVLLFLVMALQAAAARFSVKRWPERRRPILIGLGASIGVLILGFFTRFGRFAMFFPVWALGWGRGLVITWAFFSALMIGVGAVVLLLPRPERSHHPARRGFLLTLRAALLGTPAVAVGYGMFLERRNLRLREIDLPIRNLPPDLQGLRIAQLTDIHLSPFLTVPELQYAVSVANETKPHLTVVTGDLITVVRDPLEECLDCLAALRADAGVLGCLGNHEVYAEAEEAATTGGARRGIRFLRQEAVPLRFGNARLNVGGVDYQRFHYPYLVGTEKLVAPGDVNLLLSHNPDVFPVASKQGWDATLSGHTHAGQVRVEILSADLNIARVFTPFVDGIYRDERSSIFVSRGIGTIGLPARIGAPPEVALITLRRA